MRKIILSIFLILSFLSAKSQNITRIDTGTVNHARYKIYLPKDWKHKLVMVAHGYEVMSLWDRGIG